MYPPLKLTGLSPLNVAALREVFPELIERGQLTLGKTTAEFRVAHPALLLDLTIQRLPGRGHPRASLHAVKRRIRKELET